MKLKCYTRKHALNAKESHKGGRGKKVMTHMENKNFDDRPKTNSNNNIKCE